MASKFLQKDAINCYSKLLLRIASFIASYHQITWLLFLSGDTSLFWDQLSSTASPLSSFQSAGEFSVKTLANDSVPDFLLCLQLNFV